jgi:periplasmic protein TonB
MFDSSFSVSRFPTRRSGTGAIISMGTHALVLALVVRALAHPAEKKADPQPMMVRFAPAPAPPPPPPPGGPATRRTEPKHEHVHVKRDPTVLRAPVKDPPVSEPEPQPEGRPGGEPGGQPGGEPGGQLGGIPGGTLGGTGTVLAPAAPPPPPVNIVLPFGEGMNRPERVSGPEPVYPREAREAKVEGTMLVQCVITTEGKLEDCRVLKSLPFLDPPVLAALAQQRYSPVTFQGHPVAVRYVIPFKFKLQ